jgi:hypothetical protein
MTDDAPRIEPYIRAHLFASVELGLKLFDSWRRLTGTDSEAAAIMMCVSNATISPIMLDPGLRRQYADHEVLPDELRGSISRRAIAERTGLPRETVRRKVGELCTRGLLVLDANDRVRSPLGRLHEGPVYDLLRIVSEAVDAYQARLLELDAQAPPAADWPKSGAIVSRGDRPGGIAAE